MHNPDISYKSGLCLIHTWPEFPVFSLLNARICESLKFGCNLKEGMFDPQFGSLEGTGRLGIGPFPLPVRPVFWWQLPLWKPLFCWAAKSWDKQIFERLNGRCFFFLECVPFRTKCSLRIWKTWKALQISASQVPSAPHKLLELLPWYTESKVVPTSSSDSCMCFIRMPHLPVLLRGWPVLFT